VKRLISSRCLFPVCCFFPFGGFTPFFLPTPFCFLPSLPFLGKTSSRRNPFRCPEVHFIFFCRSRRLFGARKYSFFSFAPTHIPFSSQEFSVEKLHVFRSVPPCACLFPIPFKARCTSTPLLLNSVRCSRPHLALVLFARAGSFFSLPSRQLSLPRCPPCLQNTRSRGRFYFYDFARNSQTPIMRALAPAFFSV